MIKIMTVGAVVCAVALPAIAGAATPVKNVTLSKNGDFTEVTLPVPSHLLCDHFTEPATAERPFRIVLNLCDAKHAMPQQNYSALPGCMVQKIRTSQFATNPESIVRVVLDLKSSATYTVRTESDRLVVAIADPSPAFTMWEASPQLMIAKTETVSKPQAATTVEKTQTTAKQEAVSKPASPMMAQSSKHESVAKKADKPQITPPAPAASEPSAAADKPSQSMALEPVAPKPQQMQTPNSSNPSATVTVEDLVGPTLKNEAPVVTAVPQENFSLPDQPLVLAPEYLDAANVGRVAATDTDGKPASSMPAAADQPATMPAYNGNTPHVNANTNDAPMLAAVNNQDAPLTLPPTVSSSDTATTQDALIDRLKTKFFSGGRAPKPYMTEQGIIAEQLIGMDSLALGPPSPGSDMDREALLERIRQAALQNESRVPANALPSLPGGPARAEVFYDDLGRRDPFEPLLKGLRSGFLSDELPSVETLRMVGVLKDDDQAMALMEDTEGHSYILRPGDPVDNGRVLSVGESRAVIQVDEYGWTRTVVLQLSPRGGDPSKTLGARSAPSEMESETPQGE